MKVLNQTEKDGFLITEYTRDGVNVHATVSERIPANIVDLNPKPVITLEEIAEEQLLETKYQTSLLEMML